MKNIQIAFILMMQEKNDLYIPEACKKEFVIAKYYYSIGSYIASANRLKYILEYYPKYNDQIAVLRLLKDAYTKLELNDLAKNIDEIINSNL